MQALPLSRSIGRLKGSRSKGSSRLQHDLAIKFNKLLIPTLIVCEYSLYTNALYECSLLRMLSNRESLCFFTIHIRRPAWMLSNLHWRFSIEESVLKSSIWRLPAEVYELRRRRECLIRFHIRHSSMARPARLARQVSRNGRTMGSEQSA